MHEVVRQCWAAATVPTSGQPGMTAVSVNCMALTQPAAVFGRALEGLRGGVTAGRGDPITYPGALPSHAAYKHLNMTTLNRGYRNVVGRACMLDES